MTKGSIATNRKALRDYFIFETFEAGIELKGGEIKSLRTGKANLKDSFARVIKEEIFLFNLHISPYKYTRQEEADPTRPRKLLLKKNEIEYIFNKTSQKGITAIPLRIYLKHGLAKAEIALAKGKKFYDKREALKRKEAEREIDRHRKTRRS